MFPHKRTSIMFLHKLDILNRNLNGLFQKFKPVVTKLCAVTKLGDLTVTSASGVETVITLDHFCYKLLAIFSPKVAEKSLGEKNRNV